MEQAGPLKPASAASGAATSSSDFTNPIVRASRVMAECSALAWGVQREAAE